jgi:hypothetical protein
MGVCGKRWAAKKTFILEKMSRWADELQDDDIVICLYSSF